MRESVRGVVAVPGDSAYDAAVNIWNDAIERSPSGVARCSSSADGATRWVISISGTAMEPGHYEAERGWVRDYWADLVSHAENVGNYVNFMTEYEEDRVLNAYGDKYERLRAIKAKYDSANARVQRRLEGVNDDSDRRRPSALTSRRPVDHKESPCPAPASTE